MLLSGGRDGMSKPSQRTRDAHISIVVEEECGHRRLDTEEGPVLVDPCVNSCLMLGIVGAGSFNGVAGQLVGVGDACDVAAVELQLANDHPHRDTAWQHPR